MTPWAVLLVRPTDDDATIRRVYHALARLEHPDGTGAAPDPAWYAATEAYGQLKTLKTRETWLHEVQLLSGTCTTCDGLGVTGSRAAGGKIKICITCSGEGRRKG